MTFFAKADPWFLPIPDDKRLLAGPFLEASRVIVPFFEKFGPKFSYVKNDVEGNINKINEKYKQDPEKYKTLNDILEEPMAKGDKVLKNAHIGAIWLTRGLDFIQALLDVIVCDYENGGNKDGKCSVLIQEAYDKTLTNHHNFIIRNIFKPLCGLAPLKPEFMTKLKEGCDQIPDEKVIADMKEYHKNLAANAHALQQIIDELGVKE